MTTVNNFIDKISNEQTALLPAVEFRGEIRIVEHERDIAAACKTLAEQPVIGFDTETRPSFRPGVTFRVSLLQLSTPTVCYLFRLNKIPLAKPILQLLEDRRILKIGADVAGDLRSLRQIRHFRDGGFVDLQGIAPEWGIGEKSLRKLSAIVLGRRVSKAPAAEQLGSRDPHGQTAALCRDRRMGLHPHLRTAAPHTEKTDPQMIPQIYLRKGKEESLLRRHPWIFSGAIDHIKAEEESDFAEGALVEVYTRQGEFMALGHYQVGSIAVRVLTFEREEIDQAWWNLRIAVAYDVRRTLDLTDNPATTCYRLVHGEGDSLPGLVVDIYGPVAVIQCHSAGMYHARMQIAEALRTVYGARLTAIYDKSSQTLPFKAALGAVDGYLWGTSDHASHIVLENGERFCVNWEKGQKTGFFLDQRENRQLVKRYAKGRTVLNTFCYTGGFSVYALSGGAGEVCSVDSSERAVALATENMQLNFGDNAAHSEVAADAVDYLKDIGDKYDLIILDPPAFAKHHKVLGNAMQGYKRLNARALSQIRPGGILFTFSCSQAVTKELFRTTVFSAAAIAGRKVRILHQLTQPADHPINIYHPEGEYLKGLVLYVE